MIFITRELYKEYKNDLPKLKERIKKQNKMSQILFYEEEDINDTEIDQLIVALSVRDLFDEIRNAYYFTADGLIYNITNTLKSVYKQLKLNENEFKCIPLYVTALYDMAILNCWNENSSLNDLICAIEVETNIEVEETLTEKLIGTEYYNVSPIGKAINSFYRNHDSLVKNLYTLPDIKEGKSVREEKLYPLEDMFVFSSRILIEEGE